MTDPRRTVRVFGLLKALRGVAVSVSITKSGPRARMNDISSRKYLIIRQADVAKWQTQRT